MTEQSDSPAGPRSITRRALLAAGTASMATLAGCSMFGGGSSNGEGNATPTATPVPEPVTDALYSSVTIEQGDLTVELVDEAEGRVSRLSLIGPVTGGGDTAEATIYPGINPSTTPGTSVGNQTAGTQALQPSQIPRAPVYKSIQLADQTEATFTLLQPEFGPTTNNYKSGIYYLLAFGSEGVVAQRRISLVPIPTLLGAGLADNGGLLLTVKNTGTGPCYPAYGTVIGARHRNRGDPELISGGNGIFADNFILAPSQERQFVITSQQESPIGAPFSYPRSNATGGNEQDFDAESSAYCTGTGRYSHGLAVILGLVSGGYVGVRLFVTLGGEPELFEAEPTDQILCGSLTVTSSLPRQFKPVRWPSGLEVLLEGNFTEGSQTPTFGGTTLTDTGTLTATPAAGTNTTTVTSVPVMNGTTEDDNTTE